MAMISVHEGAFMIGVDIRVIRNWIHNHVIKGYRQGGESKVSKVDSKELLYAAQFYLMPGTKTAPSGAILDEQSLSFYHENNDMVSLQEAANVFAVAPGTVKNWVTLGLIRGYRTGQKLIRVRLSDIEKYQENYRMASYPMTINPHREIRIKVSIKEAANV